MEKEEKKFVNKAEEEEMVINCVFCFYTVKEMCFCNFGLYMGHIPSGSALSQFKTRFLYSCTSSFSL